MARREADGEGLARVGAITLDDEVAFAVQGGKSSKLFLVLRSEQDGHGTGRGRARLTGGVNNHGARESGGDVGANDDVVVEVSRTGRSDARRLSVNGLRACSWVQLRHAPLERQGFAKSALAAASLGVMQSIAGTLGSSTQMTTPATDWSTAGVNSA